MKTLLALLFFILSLPAFAVDRSTTERYRFAHENPCPADGQKKYVKCKDYRIDHKTPLCVDPKGDVAANMQWLKADVKRSKDAIEHAFCACVKKHGADACPKVEWK